MIAPEVLLQGYRLGVFPMAMEDGAIEWFSPDPRGVLPLDELSCAACAGARRAERRFRNSHQHGVRGSHAALRRARLRRGSTTRSSRATRGCTSSAARIRSRRGAMASSRRSLWRLDRRRVLRRVDVSPRDRRFEGGALRTGRSSAQAKIRPARYAMAHASPGAVRRRSRSRGAQYMHLLSRAVALARSFTARRLSEAVRRDSVARVTLAPPAGFCIVTPGFTSARHAAQRRASAAG